MERKLWWIKILVSSVFVFSYFNVYCQDVVAITQSSNLRINLQGIRNNKGVILLSLFSSAEGYPSDASKADQKIRMPVKKLQVPIVFKHIVIDSRSWNFFQFLKTISVYNLIFKISFHLYKIIRLQKDSWVNL